MSGKLFFTEDEIKDMKYLYFEKLQTLAEISQKYHCVVNTVKKCLKDDIRYKDRVKFNYKNPEIVQDFFSEIDTEEKAYILGYLIADGNVYYNGSYKVRFCLAKEDIQILYKFKDILRLDSKVQIHTRKNRGNSQDECVLAWSSKQQYFDLLKYGVTPRKTFTTFLPIISSSMMGHLIRGIFDGDGCISLRKNDKISGLSFSGSNQLINDLKSYLCDNLNIYPSKISSRTKKNTVYQIMWCSKKDIITLFHFMYDDATLYLDRKYNKFLKILNS